MPYTKRIVCLASSYKHNGLCIAGRELTSHGYGPWIRPISARPTRELCLADCYCPNAGQPRILDILDLSLAAPVPHHHQIENHLIDSTVTWTRHGRFDFTQLDRLLDQPATLWTHSSSPRNDSLDRPVGIAQETSLFFIKVPEVVVEVRAGRYTTTSQLRCLFRHAATEYNLSLTDQVARDYFDRQKPGKYPLTGPNGIYLTVSLTEPFAIDGRCYKLVAAILRKPPQA